MSTETLPSWAKASFFARASIGGGDVCWNWQGGKTGAGYGYMQRRGTPKLLAHRVAFHISHPGVLTSELQVHHVCENRACVNPAHLIAVTPREHKGEHEPARGERNGASRLNEEQVRAIRAELAAEISVSAIARYWGVSRRTITFIRDGETWRHVT